MSESKPWDGALAAYLRAHPNREEDVDKAFAQEGLDVETAAPPPPPEPEQLSMDAPLSSTKNDDWTLGEARQLVRRYLNEGLRCPCCEQMAKVYRRKINSSMAGDLIAMYRAFGTEWGYLPDLRKRASLKGNREESKLRYWGLVEERNERREDGGHAGWWRVTAKGEQFIRRQAKLPKYAHIYDGNRVAYSGPDTGIVEALGSPFRYDELMSDL